MVSGGTETLPPWYFPSGEISIPSNSQIIASTGRYMALTLHFNVTLLPRIPSTGDRVDRDIPPK